MVVLFCVVVYMIHEPVWITLRPWKSKQQRHRLCTELWASNLFKSTSFIILRSPYTHVCDGCVHCTGNSTLGVRESFTSYRMRSGEIRAGTQVLFRYTQCVLWWWWLTLPRRRGLTAVPPLNVFLRNNKGLPVRQHWKGLNKRKEYDETKERFSFEKDVAISFQVLWWNARVREKKEYPDGASRSR